MWVTKDPSESLEEKSLNCHLRLTFLRIQQIRNQNPAENYTKTKMKSRDLTVIRGLLKM